MLLPSSDGRVVRPVCHCHWFNRSASRHPLTTVITHHSAMDGEAATSDEEEETSGHVALPLGDQGALEAAVRCEFVAQ